MTLVGKSSLSFSRGGSCLRDSWLLWMLLKASLEACSSLAKLLDDGRFIVLVRTGKTWNISASAVIVTESLLCCNACVTFSSFVHFPANWKIGQQWRKSPYVSSFLVILPFWENSVCGNNFVFRYMYCKILSFSSFFVWIMINLESFGQVNDSMFIDDGEAIDLPDGLVQFRMNLGGTLRWYLSDSRLCCIQAISSYCVQHYNFILFGCSSRRWSAQLQQPKHSRLKLNLFDFRI